MKIERTKNAVRNVFWGVIEKTALLLLPFITRTVLIRTLGAEYLGLNSLFGSILTVLSISELGFGTAIVFSMYRPIAEDDRKTLCALLNTYRKVYRIVGGVILAAGLAVMPFLPRLVSGDVPADVNLYVLYGIYLFNTVVSYYLFAYKAALFEAHQRNDLISKRITVINILSNLVKIAVLLAFRNYYVYVIVIPLQTMVTNLVNAWMAGKVYPELVCRGEIPAEIRQDIRKRIVGLLSFRIYSVVFTSVDSLVISSFLGLTPLAIFNNYYFIQTTVVGFLTVLTRSLTAGIGNKMVTAGTEENYRDFNRIVFINGWVSSWCAVCLLCIYQPFMTLWVGGDLLLPTHTMMLLVLYFLLPRISTITHTYRDAAGLWWEDRYRPLLATVVNLTANILLVRIIGMDGVVLSTLICSICINIPWGTINLFQYYFKASAAPYFKRLAFYLLTTAAVGAAAYALCALLPGGVGGLLLRLLVCVLLPNGLFYLAYRRLDEFAYARSLAAGILGSLRSRLRRK